MEKTYNDLTGKQVLDLLKEIQGSWDLYAYAPVVESYVKVSKGEFRKLLSGVTVVSYLNIDTTTNVTQVYIG